jgi:hypothetical protein
MVSVHVATGNNDRGSEAEKVAVIIDAGIGVPPGVRVGGIVAVGVALGMVIGGVAVAAEIVTEGSTSGVDVTPRKAAKAVSSVVGVINPLSPSVVGVAKTPISLGSGIMVESGRF